MNLESRCDGEIVPGCKQRWRGYGEQRQAARGMRRRAGIGDRGRVRSSTTAWTCSVEAPKSDENRRRVGGVPPPVRPRAYGASGGRPPPNRSAQGAVTTSPPCGLRPEKRRPFPSRHGLVGAGGCKRAAPRHARPPCAASRQAAPGYARTSRRPSGPWGERATPRSSRDTAALACRSHKADSEGNAAKLTERAIGAGAIAGSRTHLA
jgi:hypothetical protein